MKEIIVDGIQIKVTRKNIKSLRLSIHPPDGEVRLSVPNRVKDRAVVDFIDSRIEWIRKQLVKVEAMPEKIELEYNNGETHLFLGKEYIIHIQRTAKKSGVEIDNNQLILYARKGHTREIRERILKEWYRERLKALIPKYIAKWEPVMEVEVKDWGVKDMKSRWGTCNIRDKRIWINLQLVKKEEKYLEYIVVHEMAHLLERLHNQRFKGYMTEFLPGWEEFKKGLNGI